ncbi:hypothetical protein C8R44DRAFT_987334 [Mycena epipterygia]|nr:hypothetical protein C8R44DRAFT_987334 [Mycena epipterygia]
MRTAGHRYRSSHTAFTPTPRAALCLAPTLLFFHPPPSSSLRAPRRRERLPPAFILAYPAHPLIPSCMPRLSRPTPGFYSWSQFVYCAIVTLVLLKVSPVLRSFLPGLVLVAQRSLHFPSSHVNSRQGASSSLRTPRKVEFQLLFGIVGSELVVDAAQSDSLALSPPVFKPTPRRATRHAIRGRPVHLRSARSARFRARGPGGHAIIHHPAFATPHGRCKDISRSIGGQSPDLRAIRLVPSSSLVLLAVVVLARLRACIGR